MGDGIVSTRFAGYKGGGSQVDRRRPCFFTVAAVVLLFSVLLADASIRAEEEPSKVFVRSATPTPQVSRAVENLRGLTAGVDYRLTDNFVFGGAVEYGYATVDFDPPAGNVDAEGHGLSFYGTYYFDDFHIDAVGSYGSKEYEKAGRVQYSLRSADPNAVATVNRKFEADPDGDDFSFSIGAGYNFNRDSFSFGPYLRASYLKSEIDGYTKKLENSKTNPGHGLAIQWDDRNIESFTTSLGGQATYVFSTNLGVLSPYMRLEWEHEYESDSRTFKGRFFNSLEGVPNLEEDNVVLITSDDPGRDYFNFGLGLAMVFPSGFMAFIDYETILGLKDINSHQFAAGLRFEY